ncbi:MAG: hypothetical protein AUG11_04735 [Nitrospirae bacterium 13_1_20CM_2_62_14]|nr:MAG: hypothetical protein AUI96_00115 [Nitrospirae bacterium 13_1_40CM_3_62_11]OLE41266.1 MAG: hypothetical protein AUG11_04735 [Nitrospirae bacterium 13_1_20CM_2_62_14]
MMMNAEPRPDSRRVLPRLVRTAATLLALVAGTAAAENVVEVPVLAAIKANNRGVFEVMLVMWDQNSEPDPVALRWHEAGVSLQDTLLDSMAHAFAYAVARTPTVRHTGTVSVQGLAYARTSTDGTSAGAAMAVGFIAVLKGESILRGVALTGTFQPDGRIGPVGAVPDKLRAAAREGYRTVLIPAGQLHDPRWNLTGLALELNVTVKEVATIDEAYELMTGRRL